MDFTLWRRWSFWHTAMLLICISYFTETALYLGNLYWWKHSPLPGSLKGLLTEAQFLEVRDIKMPRYSADFVRLLLEYSWYIALIGFGWLEWAWIKFTARASISRRIFKSDSTYDALIGAVFLGGFLFCDRLIDIIISVLSSLISSNPISAIEIIVWSAAVWSGISHAFNSFFFYYLCSLWEMKFGFKLYAFYVLIDFFLQLIKSVIFILVVRLISTPVAQMTDLPARDAIMALCESVGFNTQRIYWLNMDIMNAFAAGYGPLSTIVLFGGLRGLKNEEIVAITAHELGHWNYCHNLLSLFQYLFWSSATIGVLYLFRQRTWFKSIMRELSVKEPLEVPLPLSVVMFVICIMPFRTFFVNSLNNMISWSYEWAADQFATRRGYGDALISSLLSMGMDGYQYALDSPLFGLFYRTHPPFNIRFNLIKGGGIFQ